MAEYSRLPKEKGRLRTRAEYRCRSFSEDLIEISRACSNGNYEYAFRIIDELRDRMKSPSSKYTEEECGILKSKLISVLKERYQKDILKEYTMKLQNSLTFGLITEYRSSGYPGSYEEYCKVAAKEELINQYRNYRYGGFMHVVIIDIINEYEEQSKKPVAPSKKAKTTRRVKFHENR